VDQTRACGPRARRTVTGGRPAGGGRGTGSLSDWVEEREKDVT
jgi:hypothetical protein